MDFGRVNKQGDPIQISMDLRGHSYIGDDTQSDHFSTAAFSCGDENV
jgi:hypothetical protein